MASWALEVWVNIEGMVPHFVWMDTHTHTHTAKQLTASTAQQAPLDWKQLSLSTLAPAL